MKKTRIISFLKIFFISFILFFSSTVDVQGQFCCCLIGGCVQNFFFPGDNCDVWCTVNQGASGGYATNACIGGPCEVVLPVELEYFSAESINNKHILISWGTASESINEGFEIQRASGIKLNWETIGFLEGQGTSTSLTEYNYVDESPTPGINYYRLIQIDYDGTETISTLETASIGRKLEVDIWPTWAKDYVFIKFEEDLNKKYTIEVYDLMGRKVISQNEESNTIDISNLTIGNYIVNVFVGYERHVMRFSKVE